MHASSFDKMKSFREEFLHDREQERLQILDLGAKDIKGSYKTLFEQPSWRYRGIDLEAGPNVDIVLRDPYRWTEVKSGSCDVFISGQCFEHIEYIWVTMLEIWRVLKPGGLACIIAPSAGGEHRYPVDCWRIYPDGFRALCGYVGLEVIKTETQWGPSHKYLDNSDKWKDSMLIARKPELPLWLRLRHDLKQALRLRLNAP